MTLTLYRDIIQGTEEWHDVRRGLITASVVGKLITAGTPDPATIACPSCKVEAGPCMSAARKTPTPIKTIHGERLAAAATMPIVYGVADNDTSRGIITTLAAERITGWTEETPMNADMWRGVESEPFAREAYSRHHAPADEIGFMVRTGRGWTLGYSPDGLVGKDGLIEIKSPRAKTHVQTILADEVPAHYMPQLQAGLLVSGRKWIDFVSFVAGMPLYVKRVTPDLAWSAAIRAACSAFESSVAEIVADYATRTEDLPMTERIDLKLVI